MSTRMPGLGAGLHCVSVNYLATFGGLSAFGGKVAFGCPGGTQFVFSFETGRTQPDPQLDLWDVTWDYSWFDQDTEEAQITARLSGICGLIAGLLGLAQAEVEQSVSVQRVWTFALDVQGGAAPQQLGGGSGTVSEVLAYPAGVAGADTAAAAESGQAAPS